MERESLKWLKWGFIFLHVHITFVVDLLPDFVGMLMLFASLRCHKCLSEAEERIQPLFLVLAVDYLLHWIFPFEIGLEKLMMTVISIYANYVLLGEVARRIRESQPERAKRLDVIRVCNVLVQTVIFMVSAYEVAGLNEILVLVSLGMLIAMMVVVCGIQPEEEQEWENG